MVVRLHWKEWVLVFLCSFTANLLGSWTYERTLARPNFRIIREVCPTGPSEQQLRDIQERKPLIVRS